MFYRVTEAALATLRVVPIPRVAQFAHVDDRSFRIMSRGRVKNSGDDTNEASRGSMVDRADLIGSRPATPPCSH